MQLQFQSLDCRCLKAAAREVRNTELTQEVRLSDGMPDIGRVLSSRGQIILRSKEWQGDLMTVSGGVMVWVLYAPEDGTPPRCVDAWVPFQLKWELDAAVSEGTIRIYPLLRFVDSRSISARKIMIRTGVAALGEALCPMMAQIYEPAEMPEDIQLLRNTYPVRLQKEAGEKTFLLDEELQLPASSVEPERLLSYTVLPQLSEKRVASDKLILRGTMKLSILYRCAEGRVHASELDIPISQYAQLEEIYGSEALSDVMLGVTSLELLQNEGSQLRLKCGLVAQYLISDRYLAQITEDAYSPCRELELQMEELMLPTILEQRTDTMQVQQQVPGISGEMVEAAFLPDFPRFSRTGEHLTLEFPGQFQLLYYAPDGSLQGATARWESTMQMLASEVSGMTILVQPSGMVQVMSAGDEWNLNTQMKLEMCTRTQEGIPMLTGLEAGQLQDAASERPSLILCRSGEESLWNMAKRCASTVEDIMRINQLEGQPERGRMLLIPVS